MSNILVFAEQRAGEIKKIAFDCVGSDQARSGLSDFVGESYVDDFGNRIGARSHVNRRSRHGDVDDEEKQQRGSCEQREKNFARGFFDDEMLGRGIFFRNHTAGNFVPNFFYALFGTKFPAV